MNKTLRIISYAGLKLIFKGFHTVMPQGARLTGIENLPDGARIIAANHANATDAFHLPGLFKEQIYFVVQRDVFNIPIFGWCLWGSGQIPVYLNKKHMAILRACEELAQGHTVMVFPEGKLNPQYQAFKGSTGAVRMSLMTGAPIIPLGTYIPEENLFNFNLHIGGYHRSGIWQNQGFCYFHFGQVWYPAAEFSEDVAHAPVTQLTAELMEKIHRQVQLARQDCLADGFQPAAAFPLTEPALPPAEGD